MKRILIDTDVILDFFFDRKPFSDFSSAVLTLCEENRIKGLLTPVILSNVYYLLRQTARHEKVTDKLIQLLSILDVLLMDKGVVIHALHSGFKDFEDALQHSSAIHDGTIDAIITRNIRDYKLSEIAVLTPDDFLAILAV